MQLGMVLYHKPSEPRGMSELHPLNNLPLSRVAWAWTHGYATPKGWPAYYQREATLCTLCGLQHCSSFWGCLCLCAARQGWRDELLSAHPTREMVQKYLAASSRSYDELKLIFRLRIPDSLRPITWAEGDLHTTLQKGASRYDRASRRVLALAAR